MTAATKDVMHAHERLAALRTHLMPYLPHLDTDLWTLREYDGARLANLAAHVVPGIVLGGRVEYVPSQPKRKHGTVHGRLYALLRDGTFVSLEASGTWETRARRSCFREQYEVRPAPEEEAAALPMHIVAGVVAQHLARAGAPALAIAATEELRQL